jgi:hypothetical protein
MFLEVTNFITWCKKNRDRGIGHANEYIEYFIHGKIDFYGRIWSLFVKEINTVWLYD